MPHLRLEHSANVKEHIEPKGLFAPCHRILAEAIGANPLQCQSRAIRCDTFHVGEGSASDAFIHLEVILLEGRSSEKLHDMIKRLVAHLEHYFSRSMKELKLQLSVRVSEMPASKFLRIESK